MLLTPPFLYHGALTVFQFIFLELFIVRCHKHQLTEQGDMTDRKAGRAVLLVDANGVHLCLHYSVEKAKITFPSAKSGSMYVCVCVCVFARVCAYGDVSDDKLVFVDCDNT